MHEEKEGEAFEGQDWKGWRKSVPGSEGLHASVRGSSTSEEPEPGDEMYRAVAAKVMEEIVIVRCEEVKTADDEDDYHDANEEEEGEAGEGGEEGKEGKEEADADADADADEEACGHCGALSTGAVDGEAAE